MKILKQYFLFIYFLVELICQEELFLNKAKKSAISTPKFCNFYTHQVLQDPQGQDLVFSVTEPEDAADIFSDPDIYISTVKFI
jgi:hypothetical protein